MIRQAFDIDDYWKVVVYYNLDYGLFWHVKEELEDIGISQENLDRLHNMLSTGKAKAVTYSSIEQHISIVIFNKHNSKEDYINSIVHEAEHVKQAMLQAYQVKDSGEPPAYTIGYLVGKMYQVFRQLICEKCY